MAGRRVSFADMAGDEVQDEPGVDKRPTGRWLPLAQCHVNPRNPREDYGDLADLASLAERQLQSALGITVRAYLTLWPEDADKLAADPDAVVIVNGNRRRLAAEQYGRADLYVVVDDTIATSRAAVRRAAYDENTGRKDFDPIEEARAVADIVAEYPTAKEAAQAQGWSPTWITQRRNLLKLHPELQQQVRARAAGSADGLPIRLARALGSAKGIETMALAEQRRALAELTRQDAEAAAAKKAARSASRRQPRESTAPEHDQFSMENRPASPLPEQRAERGERDADAELAAEVGRLGEILRRMESRGLVAADDAEAIRDLLAALRVPEPLADAEADPVGPRDDSARRYQVRLGCGDTVGRDFPPLDPTTTCLAHGRQEVLGYDDTGLTTR